VIAICTADAREKVANAFNAEGVEVLTPHLATTGLV
jgi:hypothetical protein